MDDALGMRVGESVSHFPQDGDRLRNRKLLVPPEASPQRLALDIRHDVEQPVADAPRVEERKNVRMFEVGGGFDLVDEPVGADTGDDLRLHDLQRDLTIMADVLRQIDGRHTARTELALDAVAVGERCGQLSERHAYSEVGGA